MIRNLTSKKDQILDATLRLVAKKNSFDITVREIAAEAQVNIAAINYYFKSKDQLFMDMEKHFMDNFIDAFTPLDNDNLDDEEKLIQWLKKAIGYGGHYPGILVMLKEKMNEESLTDADADMKMEFIARLVQIKDLIMSVINPKEEEAEQLFMAFASCLVFPFIADSFVEGVRMQMSEEEHLQYIKLIISKFKKER